MDYSVWAVKRESQTKRIENNDFILFYVKGTGLFRGIFQITSNWYKSEKLIWEDEVPTKEKIYPFECKLKPFLIKDAIFNMIKSKLDFSRNYLTNPGMVLKGTGSGPANFNKPISKKDLDLICSHMTNVIKPQKDVEDTDHDRIIERLGQIGEALGFETYTEQEYTLVSPGAIVDMIWETKIGNLGTIRYSFEVQSKGSIKSLINNLIQSMNNPDVKKVIAVSDSVQLEKIQKLVHNTDAYTTVAKSMFVFLDIKMIEEFTALLPKFNELKKKLFV